VFSPRVTRTFAEWISGPDGAISIWPVSFSAEHFPLHRNLAACFRAFLVLYCFCAAACEAQTWLRLGPPSGEVISLAADNQGTAYLGTPDGHVFASADRGEHWELRGRAGARLDGVVQRIAVDNRNSGRVLAAVWFQDPAAGGGVFESLDGARHWKLVGLGGEAVRALEHAESFPNIWVAGTRSGVFLSTDNALRWRRITPADDRELQNVDSLAVDPGDPQIVYVGTYHLAWKTIDGGKTWSSIASGMIDDSDIMSLRIDGKNPRRIFSSACSGIYRSEDGGASWTKLQGIPYASRRTQQIVQDPSDPRTLYAATTEGLWKTSDAGETWQRVTPRETVANAMVILSGTKSARILAGTEAQGILRSDDGANFSSTSNDGFSHRIIESLAADPQNASHLLVRIAGFPDRLVESHDAGITWAEFPAASPAKPLAGLYGTKSGWWISFADGGLAQFDSAAGKWRFATFREMLPRAIAQKSARSRGSNRAGTALRTVSPRVFWLYESSDRVIAASDDGLWIRKSREMQFRKIQSKNLPRPVSHVSVASANSLLAIAANSIWKSDFDATVWSALPAPENSGRLLWIQEDSHANSPQRLVGTELGVFSSSGGPWHLLASGLPGIASVPVASFGPLRLLAMNNGGIYESADSGNTWSRVDSDAETGKVTGIISVAGFRFSIASQSEGLLVFSPVAQTDP
jgi:photosystem II stability/assembly factor-like uncharacterized protein